MLFTVPHLIECSGAAGELALNVLALPVPLFQAGSFKRLATSVSFSLSEGVLQACWKVCCGCALSNTITGFQHVDRCVADILVSVLHSEVMDGFHYSLPFTRIHALP